MTTVARVRKPAQTAKHGGKSRRGPRQRTFNVDEYYRMAEVGVLRPDERVELLDGVIVTMAPIGSKHAACVGRLNRWFQRKVREQAMVFVQSPVRLSPTSEPEPDVALLRPRADFYESGHPGPEDVLLLIEVADTSINVDRGIKLRLYAASGIDEVWVVDLSTNRVEVYRAPGANGYADAQTYERSATISPLGLPNLKLPLRMVFG